MTAAGTGPTPPPRLARRSIVVLAIVVLALLAFGTTTQTWITVGLPQDAVQTPDLAVAGSDAATGVTAFALVALAAALAASIAGRVARWVIAVVLVLSGLGIVVTSIGVATDPAAAAVPALGSAVGVSSVTGAVASAGIMPWLAVLAGGLLVLSAPWLIVAGRGWGLNRRYDAGAARAPHAPVGVPPGGSSPSIGDVPPGVDPNATEGTTRRSDEALPGRRDRTRAHADEIDSWDELSRGNDPTG